MSMPTNLEMMPAACHAVTCHIRHAHTCEIAPACRNDLSSGLRASARLATDMHASVQQGGMLLSTAASSVIMPQLRKRTPPLRGTWASSHEGQVPSIQAFPSSSLSPCIHATSRGAESQAALYTAAASEASLSASQLTQLWNRCLSSAGQQCSLSRLVHVCRACGRHDLPDYPGQHPRVDSAAAASADSLACCAECVCLQHRWSCSYRRRQG